MLRGTPQALPPRGVDALYGVCHGRHHYPPYCGRRWWYSDEPAREDEKEYLEEEKALLERRLRAIEARIGEAK